MLRTSYTCISSRIIKSQVLVAESYIVLALDLINALIFRLRNLFVK